MTKVSVWAKSVSWMGLLGVVGLLGGSLAGLSVAAYADEIPTMVRWTAVEDKDGSPAHVVQVLAQKTGYSWSLSDFKLIEERDLAFNHYRLYVELLDGIPVHGHYLRIWTELGSEKTVQVEADVDANNEFRSFFGRLGLMANNVSRDLFSNDLDEQETTQIARSVVLADAQDATVQGLKWQDEWRNRKLVRAVQVRGKRGVHHIQIDIDTHKVIAREYREYPQADLHASGETSIPVQVFSIYEEVENNRSGKVLPRVPAVLKHVLTEVPATSSDVYAALKTRRYFDYQHNTLLASTPEGLAKGYWSMGLVKQKVASILASTPKVANSYASGLLLQGRYTSINIHPDALTKWGQLGFDVHASPAFLPNWIETEVNGTPTYEMIPATAYSGKPLYSAQEAWDRPARRLADHDPKAYIADGFDEIQVYYAVDTLFEELHARGWTDPELSTRPFNSFLFNPDISMKNNAFYTDDTINFTTYSSDAQNFARDNSTIWHELGHGVMDRLMGDSIQLADTGGLSEGMADFIASMVVQAVTQGTPFPGSDAFRIINKTGFNLTNEVHDDGESYGGTMKDFMDAVLAHDGPAGLAKVVDVVLEAMRLTRDHPALTASDWFKHIQFADSLGRPGVRAPNELAPYLQSALASRNFKFDSSPVASFSIVNQGLNQDVVAGSVGSRNRPLPVDLAKTGTADFVIKASLKSSDQYAFHYPLEVRVQYNGAPIQGAIHWTGEELGTQTYTLKSESDTVSIPLQVTGTCDEVNRDDGSCVDYAYIQVWQTGDKAPSAKKRFYLRVKNP